jgi:hypothetical protein
MKKLSAMGALGTVFAWGFGAAYASPARTGHPVVGAAAQVSGDSRGGGLVLDGRWRWRGGQQLGVVVSGQALDVAYLGGKSTPEVLASEGLVLGLLPVLSAGLVEFDLRLLTGLRYLENVGAKPSEHPRALRAVSELGWLAHLSLGESYVLRAGALLGVELETQPSTALADQTQLLTLGLGRTLSKELLLFASLDAGGTYGFDGDNGKVILRGAVGLRWSIGADALTAF